MKGNSFKDTELGSCWRPASAEEGGGMGGGVVQIPKRMCGVGGEWGGARSEGESGWLPEAFN